MTSAMKAVMLRNRLRAYNPNLDFKLRNIRINGDTRGCSGFVANPKTNRIVYVNTEPAPVAHLSDKVVWRVAASFTDFHRERNRWSEVADDTLSEILLTTWMLTSRKLTSKDGVR